MQPPTLWLDREVTDGHMEALQPSCDRFLEGTDGDIITASNSDCLWRIPGREFTKGVAWERHLYGCHFQGDVDDRIKFWIPEREMNGGGNVNIVPANTPTPALRSCF